MIGEWGEVSIVSRLIPIMYYQLVGRADCCIDWSVVSVFAKGKICFVEKLRHALECETELSITGLLMG